MFDLRAVLRLDGNQFVRSMRQVERATRNAERATGQFRDQNGRLRDGMGRFVRDSNNVSNSMSRLGRAFTSPIRAVGNLTSGLHGLVGAYAAVAGMRKAFDETIGAAAKYEQSTVTISAILNDKKLGKQYMELVDNFAVDSPIMNSQDMLANSKSFLTSIGKDMKQLEKAWSLAERMAAIDPAQGVDGAVFALREMFSGDAISMVRRFEFPRAVMNEIKKLDIPDQLEALDKYFNQIGMTQKLIDDMGGTTLGIWAQVQEKFQVITRDMGKPALGVVSKFLSNVLTKLESGELDGFANIGARWMENILTGLTNGVSSVYKWFKSIANNPEFQKQTTLSGKVEWVMDDIYQRFLKWLDGGGRDKITTVSSDLIQVLIGGIEASLGAINPIALKVGTALGDGIISGVKSSIESSWLAQLLDDPVGFAMKKGSGGLIDLEKGSTKIEKVAKGKSEENAMRGKAGPLPYNEFTNPIRGFSKSHSSGLSRVPYNGYQATLHEGERVLTAEENRKYSRGGGGINIAKLADQIIVREEADIDRIGEALYRKINDAVLAGA